MLMDGGVLSGKPRDGDGAGSAEDIPVAWRGS